MNIWVILLSMAAGAVISEMYHARMWNRYIQGKREGMKYKQDVQDARSIQIRRKL